MLYFYSIVYTLFLIYCNWKGLILVGKSLKGKELGTGITQRKDGLYQARFVNRFGKRQTIYSRSLNDIRKQLREEQHEDAKQVNVVDRNTTLNEWYEIWMSTCKKHCRNTTQKTYATQYNRLRKELGWRKLVDLNLVILQKAFNELKSDASRSDCKALLVDMLNCAVNTDLLVKNVAYQINTKIDNEENEEKRILTPEEVDLLLKSSRDGRLYPMFVVALNTGMRMGEILGLTWDCVDFEKDMIYVNKTLCTLSNGGKTIYDLHPPKTKAGKRNIPMSKLVKETLLEQKAWKDKVDTKYKPRDGFENLVFTSKTNNPLHASNVKDSINYLIERIRVNNPEFEHFTPHGLRHTFATNCISKGMQPKTLQKILGHTSLKMTMDLYCHVLDDTLREEMGIVMEMV